MVSTDEPRIPAISIVKFLLTIINGRKSLAINEEGYILYVTGVLDPYPVSMFMLVFFYLGKKDVCVTRLEVFKHFLRKVF